jgi:hypothetical protein
MFLQITIHQAIIMLMNALNNTKKQLFLDVSSYINTWHPAHLSLDEITAQGLDVETFYSDLDEFFVDYLSFLIDQFNQHRTIEMNEAHYSKSMLEKLWLLFSPILDFFETLGPVWTAYFLSQPHLSVQLESLFSYEQPEFALISMYIEHNQKQQLINSVKDSDDLSADLHQTLLELIRSWTDTSLPLSAQYKPLFLHCLDAKENLD